MDVEPKRYSFLKVEIDDGLALVTFNKPETGNKWSRAEEWEMDELPGDLAGDDRVRAVVMTGSGDTFSGGAHHADDPFDASDYYDRSVKIFASYMDLDKPMVIALNGHASGSGLTLAMFGDIVVVERHVEFRDAHVLGSVVTATGPFLWPPSMGLMRAKRYLLTGDTFSADDAERFGLVSEVVDTGHSLERATELATQLAALSPKQLQATKRALNRWLKINFGPVFEHALSLEFMTFPAAERGYGQGVIH